MQKYKIIIPILNGGELWKKCVDSILAQNIPTKNVIVIDSGSADGSFEISKASGFFTQKINKSEFNHGKTRQDALSYAADAELVIYMTQDAILQSRDSINNLLAVFDDSTIGCAFGRQIARDGAGALEAHSRVFNYPEFSYKHDYNDRKQYGIKTAFISNSFAAYRVKELNLVGGFPSNVILGEDTYVAAKLLKSGYKVAYVSDAVVRHSHNYTLIEEFKRYFDIGVFHVQNDWMIRDFGKPEGEGLRYIRSELVYVLRKAPFLLPKAFASHFLKYLGYKLGLNEGKLPLILKRLFSMHKLYWTQN